MVVQKHSSPACSFLSQLSQKQSVAFFPNTSCSLSSPRKKIITLLIFLHFMPLTFQPYSPFPALHQWFGVSNTEILPPAPIPFSGSPLCFSDTVTQPSLTLSPSCFIQIKPILFNMVEMECDKRVMPSKSPHPLLLSSQEGSTFSGGNPG